MSGLLMPAGNISRKQVHAPKAQKILISFEERRFIIRTISGMFQRGSIILATKAILVSITIPTA
jgi:hypothetical protein